MFIFLTADQYLTLDKDNGLTTCYATPYQDGYILPADLLTNTLYSWAWPALSQFPVINIDFIPEVL